MTKAITDFVSLFRKEAASLLENIVEMRRNGSDFMVPGVLVLRLYPMGW
jgi:hypothetical protein